MAALPEVEAPDRKVSRKDDTLIFFLLLLKYIHRLPSIID
jgi:hypothetical protein